MRNFKLIGASLLLPVFLTGCTTFTITNLTASSQPRNEDGMYPVEMEVTSNQTSLRRGSITPYVVVGFDFYPMRPTPLLSNRFETLVPVRKEDNLVHFRFKVDYEYNMMGGRGQGSKMSTEYILSVKD
jgi:hypothetical protein